MVSGSGVDEVRPKRILWVSDFDMKTSGYQNLSTHICAIATQYDYEVIALGLGYQGEEHHYPFSIVPCNTLQECVAILHNFNMGLWNFDYLVVALDIPMQEIFLGRIVQETKKYKYIVITPVENPPVCSDWAMLLAQADHVFTLSEVGKKAIEDSGVAQVSRIPIGVDSSVWTPLLDEEMEKIARKTLGFGEDDYIVLTVADNQERKNLSAAFEIVAKAREKIPNIKYILVSRQFQPTGWRLYDMANYYKINDIFSLYERGMPAQDLSLLYSVSNVFLLTSKAEGLGIPVLEAMSCGIPILVSDTGALSELVSENRGWNIPIAFTNLDVWGNSYRGFVDPQKGADLLVHMYNSPEEVFSRAGKAHEYIHNERTWAGCARHFMEELEKLNEQK